MPNFCAVVGCGSRGNRDLNHFFRIPAIPARGSSLLAKLKMERRQKWIIALRRKDLTETKLKYATICDKHFITGRPAELRDFNHPDWVPSVRMGYKTKSNLASQLKRYNRIKACSEAGGTIQGASPSTNIDSNDYLEDSYEEETNVSGAGGTIQGASPSTNTDSNDSLEDSYEEETNVSGAGGTIQGASPSTNTDSNDSLEDSYEEETNVSGAEPSGAGGTIQGASLSTNIDSNDSLEDSYEEETNISGAERTGKLNAETLQTETRYTIVKLKRISE